MKKLVGSMRHLKTVDCSEMCGKVRCPLIYQNCDVKPEECSVCGHVVDKEGTIETSVQYLTQRKGWMSVFVHGRGYGKV